MRTALFAASVVMRVGSAIDASVFVEHAYEPGLPSERFSGQQCLDFLIGCFAESAAS